MVDGIGDRSGLARAAIEAALKRHSEALGRAADIVERAVAQGIDAAMNQYNHPKAPAGKKK